MPTQLGKRYLCDTCGTEILCNKAGSGAYVLRPRDEAEGSEAAPVAD